MALAVGRDSLFACNYYKIALIYSTCLKRNSPSCLPPVLAADSRKSCAL